MASNYISTYDGAGNLPGGVNAEDVYGIIQNTSITETPFVSSAPQTTTKGVTHEWLTDVIPAVSTTAAVEGADFSWGSYGSYAARVRLNNTTQIFRRDIRVSGTQEDMASPLGVDREYAYQVVLNTQAIARNLEYMITTKTATLSAVGSEGTARYMYNIRAFSGRGSGYTMPQADIAGGMTLAAVNTAGMTMRTNGAKPDTVLLSLAAKAALTANILYSPAAAASSLSNYNQSPLGSYSGNITMIQTDSGVYAIVPSLLMDTHAQASVSCPAFMYERAKLRVAWGRKLRHKQLAPGGDSVRGIIVGEATLEVLHPTCCYIFQQVTT